MTAELEYALVGVAVFFVAIGTLANPQALWRRIAIAIGAGILWPAAAVFFVWAYYGDEPEDEDE